MHIRAVRAVVEFRLTFSSQFSCEQSVKKSYQFIRKITEPLLPLLIRYTCFFLVIGVVLALASSVEAYASPVLMKEVVEAINKK